MAARCIPNDSETFLAVSNPETHLAECLTKITTDFPPKESWTIDEACGGLYIGPTALSYLFFHLSKSHPALKIGSKAPDEWALNYISGSRPPTDVSTANCGVINEEVCFCAVAAAVTQDISYVHRLVAHIDSKSLLSSSGSNEWVYGRSGFLYALRLVRAWVPSSAAVVNPAIASVVECIFENGPNWVYREKHYTGAGHGDIGIITQIILSDPAYAPKLEAKLSELLDVQTESGTWPYATEDKKEIVQFCHGAPGFVLSLVAIRDHFPSLHERIDHAISRARECTWKDGLLKKEPNLCHGVTGNAFAFPPGPQRDHFLAYGTSEKVQEGKDKGWWVSADYGYPFSVGFGSVPGRAWGWMARNRNGREYITYNDV